MSQRCGQGDVGGETRFSAHTHVPRDIEAMAADVVDAAVKLHVRFGPGLLEHAYQLLLARDLARRGHAVQRQLPLTLEYDGILVRGAFKPDLLVNGRLVVELKAAEKLTGVFFRQVMTYLRILELPLGLLINFGEQSLKGRVHRILNPYPSRAFLREK